MFSIGEFARLGTVSVRTLRHYDEIGLLRPARVDPETGYRSYSAGQLAQLNRIIALKDLGFSLEQANHLLCGITVAELRGMLTLRRAQLEQELDEYTNRLLGVEARLRYIEREDAMPADDITVKKIPAMGVVSARLPDIRSGPRHLDQRNRRHRPGRRAGVRDPAAVHPPRFRRCTRHCLRAWPGSTPRICGPPPRTGPRKKTKTLIWNGPVVPATRSRVCPRWRTWWPTWVSGA